MKAIKVGENKRGEKIALVTSKDGFSVYRRAENYNGHVRGGLEYSWRYIARGLTRDAADALFAKRATGAQP